MTGNIAVFVTDQRQKNLAEYLPGKKVLLDWHNTQKKGAVEELVENCGYFIFPTPVSKLNRYPKLEDMLKYELINEKHEDKTVIGGAFTDKWIEYLQQHKISYFDLMKDENVVQKNAHITAEATVAEILKYSAYSIYGQKIIVCGYGKAWRICWRQWEQKLQFSHEVPKHARWQEVTDMRQSIFPMDQRKSMVPAPL